MNNMSTSECSSGCESGWTTYLDQSSHSGGENCQRDEGYRGKRPNVGNYEQNNEEEDEDLSMVSDASSGPRQFHEEEDSFDDCREGYFGYFSASASEQRKAAVTISKNKSKNKADSIRGKQNRNSYLLDDTASSPVLNLSKKDEGPMEHDMGFSKESKGKSAFQKHFGFLKPSATGKSASEKSGGLQGRKWQ